MRQQGFTLLEVLVAMVIVSIGLVGLAGLMMTSAKNNQSAYYRSQASWLGYDIIDRMRANRVLAQGGSYDIALGVMPTGCGAASAPPAGDLCQWNTELQTALPTGKGSIVVSGSVATVTVSWDDRRGLGANANFTGNQAQSISIQTQL
ncbi:MAG: type IV pilus modification protein PilV [Pseudomonadota bacterium]